MKRAHVAAGAIGVALFVIIALAAGSSRRSPAPSSGGSGGGSGGGGSPPPANPEPEPDLGPVVEYSAGKNVGVYSLADKPGSWCGAPVIPKCTADYGSVVLDVPGSGLVWGWTPPGDLRAATKYGKRLIADLEMRSSTKAKPSAGWTGDELAAAEQLAPLVWGVTSHGYVAPSLRDVLGILAQRDVVAMPQVYDSDRSTEPRKFLRDCLDSYHKAGFRFIVPLLGASAGADYLREWIDECRARGVPYALWSLQRLAERKIDCAALEGP